MCAFVSPFSPSSCRRPKRLRSPPGTPGPHTADDRSITRQRAYPPASPSSAQKLHHFRAELFKPMPDLRSGTSTATLEDFPLAGPSSGPSRPPPVHATPPSDDDGVQPSTDNEEQVDASPRRPAPRRPAAPDLEDALTRLTQTVERMAAIQQRPPEPGADVNEDPDFN